MDVLLTTTYWLTDKLALLGKVGAAYEMLDQTVSCNSGDCTSVDLFAAGMTDTRYNINPEIMAGLGWQFAPQWRADFLYQHIISNAMFSFGSFYQRGTYNNPSISSLLLGVDYQMTGRPWAPGIAHGDHPGGWHAGMTIGPNVIDTQQFGSNDNLVPLNYTLNNRSLSSGLYIGYDWPILPRWLLGVESGYQDLGASEWRLNSANINDVLRFTNKYSALDVLLTTTYWLTDKVALLGKLGVAYEVINQTGNCNSGDCTAFRLSTASVNSTRYNVNPEFAAGFGWQFAPQWQADFLYQRVISNAIFSYARGSWYQNGTYNNPTISSFLLGLDYQMTDRPWAPNIIRDAHLGGWHIGMGLGPNVIDTQEYGGNDNFDSTSYTLNNRSLSTKLYLGYDWSVLSRWLVGVEGASVLKVNSKLIELSLPRGSAKRNALQYPQ
jgi:hypothetical protein